VAYPKPLGSGNEEAQGVAVVKSSRVLLFERVLTEVIREEEERRNRVLERRARSIQERSRLSLKNIAIVFAVTVVGLLLMAPLWVPFLEQHVATGLIAAVTLSIGGVMVLLLIQTERVRVTMWGNKMYPLSVMYDRVASQLVRRCSAFGIDKAEVKYLFALSKADASLNVTLLETTWKYGGGTFVGILLGAKAPISGKLLLLSAAVVAVILILKRIVDPSLRRSQIAVSVDHRCK
jgi:hypothetical protein